MLNNNGKFYITTTLPYVNADPHIGFAAEIVRADMVARWQRYLGNEVFFNTGTDEHGLKIQRKAEESGQDTQAYVDEYAARFDRLKAALDLSYNNFIRTTDPKHKRQAQEFWKRCAANGDIYKKSYKIKYCVGCELEKTDSELVDGHCPLHPGQEMEMIEEENYFFRWSNYSQKLLDFYRDHPNFVVPANRFNEIKRFIERGLKDFSVSRLKAKMPWGVPVPDDDEHVMYVWFDALTNYINCLNWVDGSKEFYEFWPGLQVAGKDNLRQQSAMWQAMLQSAGLPNSRQVLIFGFITSAGQKMSKSLGNVADPFDLVEKYGSDALRYYLLADLKPFEDSDYTEEKFRARYSADLANGLGNLVARVANLLEKHDIAPGIHPGTDSKLIKEFKNKMDNHLFDEAVAVIWQRLRKMDEYLSAKAPWKMEDAAARAEVLIKAAQTIVNAADLAQTVMPATAAKILAQFGAAKISKGAPLFPRLDV